MPEAIGTLMQVLDTALRFLLLNCASFFSLHDPLLLQYHCSSMISRPQRLRKCVQVLYALLHESHSVEESFVHPAVQTMLGNLLLPSGLVGGIVQTMQHYLAVVESLVSEGNAGKFTATQVYC